MLQKEAPGGLNGTHSHLFVDAELGQIVRSNHERVVQGFDRMHLRLEKARFRMMRDVDS